MCRNYSLQLTFFSCAFMHLNYLGMGADDSDESDDESTDEGESFKGYC